MYRWFKQQLFSKPQLKVIVKQGQGKRSRWRWEAYRGNECVAVSPINGFDYMPVAVLEARIMFSKSFDLSVFHEHGDTCIALEE